MAKTEEQAILDIRVKYEDAINGIIAYKQKIAELKEQQEQLKEAMDKGTISTKEGTRQIEAIDATTKVYKENVRNLQKEVQNNIKTEREQEGSLKQLRAELANVTKAFDSLSRTEREGAKGKEMQEHINRLTDEIKAAEEATQRFQRNVGNYEGAINNAIFGNSKFGQSLQGILEMTQGGQGLSGAVQTLTARVLGFKNAVSGLLANPYFLALAGIAGAGAAFKWWYDYNTSLVTATRLTREFLGLTGDGLKAMRDDIQATADTYGKDFKDVLATVDGLVAQYKMSAQDALNVLNEGFAAGADLNGDMLAKIQQYAPAFHDAGISASELVAIIQQTRSGIFGDNGLALIQMASKKIREISSGTAASLDAIGVSSTKLQKDLEDGTITMFDAIRQVSQALAEVPANSQQAGDVLKNVFGKQGAAAGQEMVKELGRMTTSLGEVKEQTGAWGDTMDKQRAASKELNDTMAALFDASDKGFASMKAGARLFATQMQTDVVKGLISVINYFIDLYNRSTMVRGAVQVLSAAFRTLWNTIKLVAGLAVNAVKAVAKSVSGLADIVEGIVTLSFDKVKQGFVNITKGIGNEFKSALGNVKKFGYDTGSAYINAVNSTIKGAKVEQIKLPQVSGNANTGGVSASAASSGKTTQTSGKTVTGTKSAANSSTADALKKEQEEVRKAEDLLSGIVAQSYEERREVVARKYDRMIEDIRQRLTTEKNLTTTARKAMNAQVYALEQTKAKQLTALSDEQRKKDIESEQQYISTMLEVVKKGSDEEYQLRLAKIENEKALALQAAQNAEVSEEERQRNIWAINQKYNKMIEDADAEHQNTLITAQQEAIKKRYEQQILQSDVDSEGNDEVSRLRLEMQEKQELLATAQQMEGESIEEFNTRKLQMERDYQEAKKALNDKEVNIEQAKVSAIASVMGGLQQIAEAAGEENTALAKAAKVLALAEIAINTGKAIAAGVAQAQKVPFPENIAAIATTVATILANIATATKTVKSAKFAEGGLVTGEGTGTSDSIPAYLSNGESVMTARTTSMFAPILSAFNQLGGGAPVTVLQSGSSIGEDMLANAVARGVMAMPAPVVSVEEIDSVRARVKAVEAAGSF